MARPRKQNREEALSEAMVLFWETGFCRLSTRDIEERSRITRFTLQTSFGGKEALFLAALDTYLDLFEAQMAPKMTDGRLETLAAWFAALGRGDALPGPPGYGCLMINTIVEFADRDAEVSQRAERFFAMMRGGFSNALLAAQEHSTLPRAADANLKAELLLGSAIGIMVLTRSAGSRTGAQALAKATAAQIRDWQSAPNTLAASG